MNKITLKTRIYDDCTLGRLFTDNGFSCFTLELPWKANEQNVSCIPAGTYQWKKRHSPSKDYTVIELEEVPNRRFIQIHIGNRTSQILGCILPGTAIKDYNDDGIPDVINSEVAFTRLMDSVGDRGEIEVIR